MTHDPYRPQGQFEQPGPRGFSINPGDRPYQPAGEPPPDPTSRSWFGRIVVGGLVMALCAGGVWYGATKARSHLNPGEAPLIRADTTPVKVKPDNPSGMSSDETPPTYDRQSASHAQVEQLLPPPETPMARPQPAAELSATAPPPQVAASPPAAVAGVPQPPPAREIASAPVPKAVPLVGPPTPLTRPLPQTMPADKADSSNDDNTPPAQRAAAAVPPPKAKSANMTGPMRVQIAATVSPAAAQQEWHRLQHAHADLLGTLQPTVVKVDIPGKGTFYRVQAGPVDNKAAADKLCAALKKVSIGCIAVHP